MLRKILAVFLIIILALTVVGCTEDMMNQLISAAIDRAIAEKSAQTEGTLICPKERPYRISGIFGGICVDETGFNDYYDLKDNATEATNYVLTTKALQQGIDNKCPQDKPYYIGNGWFGGSCVSKDDFNNQKGIVAQASETKCTSETDCNPTCEERVMWKQSCNIRTGYCEKTFETDCGAVIDTFGDLTFKETCTNGECTKDLNAMLASKNDFLSLKKSISEEVKSLLTQRQTLVTMQNQARQNCITGLSDVTNEFILESATKVVAPMAGVASLVGETGSAALNKLANNPQKMTAEEFITTNCQLNDALKGDLANLDTKIQKDEQVAQNINDAIKAMGLSPT